MVKPLLPLTGRLLSPGVEMKAAIRCYTERTQECDVCIQSYRYKESLLILDRFAFAKLFSMSNAVHRRSPYFRKTILCRHKRKLLRIFIKIQYKSRYTAEAE